jgi:hypothetical protein
MSLSDWSLIGLLQQDSVSVRSAALELLSSSFSTDARWLPQVFASWDRYGVEAAFPEFPMLTHVAITSEHVGECIARASTMVAGRAITDKVCRCAGKLLEAISISAPATFVANMPEIRELKKQSKIFFRVNDVKMQARCDWIHRDFPDLAETLATNLGSIGNLYEVLESQYLQGKADGILKEGLQLLVEGTSDRSAEQVATMCLELCTRYRMLGYEETLADLVDHGNPMIADAAAIGLARCRTDTTLPLIADRFADYSKQGQLRSIDVLRRGRLSKTSQLLRFLKEGAQGSQVKNALVLAETLQFDLSSLEDFLEALVTVDDTSLARFQNQLAIIPHITSTLDESDRARTLHFLKTRWKEAS